MLLELLRLLAGGVGLLVEVFAAIESFLRDFLVEDFPVHSDHGLLLQIQGREDAHLIPLGKVYLVMLIKHFKIEECLLGVLQCLLVLLKTFFCGLLRRAEHHVLEGLFLLLELVDLPLEFLL